MNDDVRKYIYNTIIVFVIGVSIWISILFVASCGFSLNCRKGALPIARTPVPTLHPATLPADDMNSAVDTSQCRVAAADLIGAWVSAGSSKSDNFEFAAADGATCVTTFEEVQPLFNEGNVWNGELNSCSSCHTTDLVTSSAQLDLTSYDGITAGSRRADATAKGTDIMGGGNWKKSLLYEFVTTTKDGVIGHQQVLADGAFVYAGKPIPAPTSTPKPTVAPEVTPTP